MSANRRFHPGTPRHVRAEVAAQDRATQRTQAVPGPWVGEMANGEPNIAVIVGTRVARPLHDEPMNGRTWLAQIRFNGEQTEAVQVATLRMMVAAPEMLAALMDARKAHGKPCAFLDMAISKARWGRDDIETSFDFPPIPARGADWSATLRGYDAGDSIGRGETEEAAVADLLRQEEGS